MTRVTSVFSQILQLFPRLEFENAVKFHKAERHSRGFSCWGLFRHAVLPTGASAFVARDYTRFGRQ